MDLFVYIGLSSLSSPTILSLLQSNAAYYGGGGGGGGHSSSISSKYRILDNDDDGGDTPPPSPVVDPSERYQYVPAVYMCVGALWMVVVLLWVAHLIKYRKKYPFLLHRVLLVVPACKLVYLALGSTFFIANCVTSRSLVCTCVALLFNASSIVFEMLSFMCLFLMSRGLNITRTSLTSHELRTMVWNVSCLAICHVAMQINPFFMFPLIVMYVVIFGHIFSAVILNIRSLYGHLLYYQERFRNNAENNSNLVVHNPATAKVSLFRRLQMIITTFLSLNIIVSLAFIVLQLETDNQSLWNRTTWARLLADELIHLFIVCLLAYTVRLRNFAYFARFNVVSLHDIESQEVEVLVDNNNASDAAAAAAASERQPLLLNLATALPTTLSSKRQQQRLRSAGGTSTATPSASTVAGGDSLASEQQQQQEGGTETGASSATDHDPVLVIQNPCHQYLHGEVNSGKRFQYRTYIALQPDEPPEL